MDVILEKAKQGDRASQVIMWSELMNQVPRDYEEIEHWLEKASAQGDTDSIINLIELLEKKLKHISHVSTAAKTIKKKIQDYKKILTSI